MSVKSVQLAVAAHIMAVLGFDHGAEVSSATLAGSVDADPTLVRKSFSKLSKAGLVVTKRGKRGSIERACASSATDHAVGQIPCKRGATGVCDSFVSGGKQVSGQSQPQGMHEEITGGYSVIGVLLRGVYMSFA